MEFNKLSAKKVYEFILSAKESSSQLREAILSLLRRAIDSPEHFDFLLHRVNWFDHPLVCHSQELQKTIRLYRGRGRQCAKVAYNLLTEALSIPTSYVPALECLQNLFPESYDQKIILQSLKQSYPHKLCDLENHLAYQKSLLQLSRKFHQFRTDLLEIMIQNLASFDTQILIGQQWVHQPFPEDQKIVDLRESTACQSQISHKFDLLLSNLLDYLETLKDDETIMSQIFLAFQNKILPIKTTKIIQFVVFWVAESSKNKAGNLISFLLSNIFQQNNRQNEYRIFTQSTFYLFSYIMRSKKLSNSYINKILLILIQRLKEKIIMLPCEELTNRVQMMELFQKHQKNLFIIQTIIMIWIYRFEEDSDSAAKQQYEELLRLSKNRIYFQYFLKESILERINIKKIEQKKSLTLKFSNKFIPPCLKNVGEKIDKVFKFSEFRNYDFVRPQQLEGKLYKKLKQETKISSCSQTIF